MKELLIAIIFLTCSIEGIWNLLNDNGNTVSGIALLVSANAVFFI